MARNKSIEMLKKRLMAEFARDKKKAVTLLVLAVLAVFFVGKLLLKGAPEEATAAANPTVVAPDGAPLPSRAVTAKSPTPEALKGAAKGITRDIFMPDASIFPRIGKTTNMNGKVNVVDNKQDKRGAELRRKSELIQEQGAELHLESTITGRVPIAIINGTVLGPGGVINGFRIVKINSQACVVEKEGVRLNLTME